jgi:succinate dehydrogenase / fumarate reductase flavoprotein subunit
MMQRLVGIVRTEDEMRQAVKDLEALKARAARAGVTGHRSTTPAGIRRSI